MVSEADKLKYLNQIKQTEKLWSRMEYRDAEKALKEILEALKDEKEQELDIEAMTVLGLVYIDMGNLSEAGSIFQELIMVSSVPKKSLKGLSAAFHGEGLIYIKNERWQIAKENLEKALAYRQKIGDSYLVAESYDALGKMYFRMGNFQNCHRQYKNALELRLEIAKQGISVKNKSLLDLRIALSYSSLGLLYLNRREYDLAQENLEQSLLMFEQVRAPSAGRLLTWLGNLYTRIKDYDKAISMYKRSYALRKEINDIRGILLNQFDISVTYILKESQNEAKQAIDEYREFLKIPENVGTIEQNQRLREETTILFDLVEIFYQRAFKKEGIEDKIQILLNMTKTIGSDYIRSIAFFLYAENKLQQFADNPKQKELLKQVDGFLYDAYKEVQLKGGLSKTLTDSLILRAGIQQLLGEFNVAQSLIIQASFIAEEKDLPVQLLAIIEQMKPLGNIKSLMEKFRQNPEEFQTNVLQWILDYVSEAVIVLSGLRIA